MVSRCCNNRNRTIDPIWSLMPIPPFCIPRGIIYEVSSMKSKSCSWSLSKSFSENAGPMSSDFVLGITKINKTKRSWSIASSFEMIVLGPIYPIPNSVGIKRIWFKTAKSNAMIVSFIDITFKVGSFSLKKLSFQCPSIGICNCQKCLTLFCSSVSSPCYGLGGGRIIFPGQNYSVG